MIKDTILHITSSGLFLMYLYILPTITFLTVVALRTALQNCIRKMIEMSCGAISSFFTLQIVLSFPWQRVKSSNEVVSFCLYLVL